MAYDSKSLQRLKSLRSSMTQELKNVSRRILAPGFSGSTLENFLTIAIRTPQRLPSDWGPSQHKHRFIEKCREVGKVKKLQFRGFFF